MERIALDQIASGWELFLRGRHAEASTFVRPVVLQSWVRSWELAVTPFDLFPSVLAPRAVQQLRSENAALLELAAPVIRDLQEFVRGTGFVTALTDGRGVVLKVAGDRDSLSDARAVGLVPGANWSEVGMGTNTMGLVLVDPRPIQIVGREHYSQNLHKLTCSAAPIFDTAGKLMGVLDMSGPSDLGHAHTLGMVVAAAKAIERQFRLSQANAEAETTEATLEAVVAAMGDPVVLIDQEGKVIKANSHMNRLGGVHAGPVLGLNICEVLGAPPLLQSLISRGQGFVNEDLTVRIQGQEIVCVATARPVRADDRNAHFLLTFQEVRQHSHRLQRPHGNARFTLDDMLGVSSEMKQLKVQARKAAQSDLTTLLLGESGTGKELLAHGVHHASERRDRPFLVINCGAIPRDLLESELFGYEAGAFTGASRQGRPGKFEVADGGSLFLDEIGEMPMEMQVALLRVLEEHKVTRIGASRPTPVNVRVIAATNRDLAEQVSAGRFRADLLYRLDVLTLSIPPLRARPKDVPYLIAHFLARHESAARPRFSEQAMALLCRYSWPGNVRQLQNLVAKCVHLVDGNVINLQDLPSNMREAAHTANPLVAGLPLVELARKSIESACWQSGGNLSQAARLLGISRPTLYRKMKEFGIDLARERHH